MLGAAIVASMRAGGVTAARAQAAALTHACRPPQHGGSGTCPGCQRAGLALQRRHLAQARTAAAQYRAPLHGQAGSGA